MDDPAARLLLTRRILHLALMAAVLVYGVVGVALAASDALPEPLIEGGAAWAVRALAGVAAAGVFGVVAVVQRPVTEAAAGFAPAPARVLSRGVLTAMLCEFIGVLGLVLLMLTGELLDVLVFVGLSEAALLGTFPRG